jgi:hypothetical protein
MFSKDLLSTVIVMGGLICIFIIFLYIIFLATWVYPERVKKVKELFLKIGLLNEEELLFLNKNKNSKYLAVFCDRKVKIDVNDNDFLELLEKAANDIKSDYDKYRERSRHFDDLRSRIKDLK